MSLYERLRDCEAAPWVIKEIEKLEMAYEEQEAELLATCSAYDRLNKENKKLEEENVKMREALMSIAVAEGREHYSQELWAALLMDKARSALQAVKKV